MRGFGKACVARVIEGENIPALSARKCMKKSGEAGFLHSFSCVGAPLVDHEVIPEGDYG
jgi:hypothetical protein